MLLNALLVVLSSQCVWARKSEPSFDEADAGFFRGSDKYDFAIEVPAAGAECFWHFAHQSGSFYLMYLVRLSRTHLQDWVSSPLQSKCVYNSVSVCLNAQLDMFFVPVCHIRLITQGDLV